MMLHSVFTNRQRLKLCVSICFILYVCYPFDYIVLSMYSEIAWEVFSCGNVDAACSFLHIKIIENNKIIIKLLTMIILWFKMRVQEKEE